MKKRNSVVIAALFIVLAANSLSFAQNINYSAQNRIALGEDILKEVIKRTIYEVGNKVIEKYGPGSNFLNNIQNNDNDSNTNTDTNGNSNTNSDFNEYNSSNSSADSDSTTTNQNSNTSQNTNSDNEVQEELIPVS